MNSFNDLVPQLIGLSTLSGQMTVSGFILMGLLTILAAGVFLCAPPRRAQIDRGCFWAIGLALVGFAVLRPIGIARDDVPYEQIVRSLCPLNDCSQGAPVVRDYVWYYLVKFGLYFRPDSMRVALALSGFGVLIKLYVIDRLCSQRLLALLLFIPLCYVQYDLTQLRAGLAIAWMMLGICLLVQSRWVLGSIALGSNFLVHSQAIFSPGLLIYKFFGLSHWVLPIGLVLFLGLLYAGLYPTVADLKWLRVIPETSSYYSGSVRGTYAGVKIFPWAYFLIIGYGIWLCNAFRVTYQSITQIVAAGLFLGVFLAWFFAINPTMQTRIFEFYTVPLVLLAGNVGYAKLKIALTVCLAWVLYMRLELLHDWILG